MQRSQKKTSSIKKTISIHGVLLDVFGVGVLVTGPSGIGKSECAIDLIARGHRLVADDLVLIVRNTENNLIGFAPELSRDYLEVRGLGLLNIRDLFGAVAVRDKKKIDMVLELIPYSGDKNIDRIGIDIYEKEILECKLPHVRVPSWKSRNLTTMIEVAARNQILRWAGKDSAIEFEKRHQESLCKV